MMFPFFSELPYFGPDKRRATGWTQYILTLRSLKKSLRRENEGLRDKRKLSFAQAQIMNSLFVLLARRHCAFLHQTVRAQPVYAF
jgi:hypothetical protein